jgi:hypothetical protein
LAFTVFCCENSLALLFSLMLLPIFCCFPFRFSDCLPGYR